MSKQYIKSAKAVQKESIVKPDLIIFDFDGCIANSDDFIVTNKEAYKLDKLIHKMPKERDNDICLEYLQKHNLDIEPYEGIFKLFVKLCLSSNIALVTSRFDYFQKDTFNWLKIKTIEHFNESIWRQMRFNAYFNVEQRKSLEFKRDTMKALSQKYNIVLLIDDHPEVVNWAEGQGITVLTPSTGYKNLNSKDLMETNKCTK